MAGVGLAEENKVPKEPERPVPPNHLLGPKALNPSTPKALNP